MFRYFSPPSSLSASHFRIILVAQRNFTQIYPQKQVFGICAFLRYYAASSGNPLQTFRNNISVPSSRIPMSWTSSSFKMGPIHCPETSVKDYHSTLSNTPEERKSHQCRRESLEPQGGICLPDRFY
jgi:hypothetical protein